MKVVINLLTGLEDAERLSFAFLTATAAQKQGKPVIVFCTKEAVRLGVPGYADEVEWEGAPPMEKLLAAFARRGGELLLCPISFAARELDESDLVANARVGGATPLWEWVGDEPATVFTY
jgi:predicted peroxiredoxin